MPDTKTRANLRSRFLSHLEIERKISLPRFAQLARMWKTKQSCLERRVRELRNPDHPDYSKHVKIEKTGHYISSYHWK